MSKLSSEEYLKTKIKPIFDNLTELILHENPSNPNLFIIEWLKNYTGYTSEGNERKELLALRKELKKLKENYHQREVIVDDEQVIVSDEDDEAENNDEIEDMIEKRRQSKNSKMPRSSVSAEVYGIYHQKKNFTPKVIDKTLEQIERIQNKVLKSFMFNSLDDRDLRTVVNAMEEFVCKEGDIIISQGDAGSVLYIIEKGEFDCFKVFNKDEEPVLVKHYGPEDSFGELALLYNAPRAATIKAKQDGVLWTLDRETFNHIVKESAMKKREKYVEFLKSVSILKHVDDYEISQICDALKIKKYKNGDVIIKQNDNGEDFYIIESGHAKATKVFEEGKEAEEVKKYSIGDYFGELALIKNEPRAANIICTDDTICLSLDRKSFKRLLGPIENILKRNSDDYKKYIVN